MNTTEHKQFKPFDKVLARKENRIDDKPCWKADIFSHIDEDGFYVTIGLGCVTKDDIIPYEGNEYLLGTFDEPEEEVKLEEGEWVMVCDNRSILPEEWLLRHYYGYCNNGIRIFNNLTTGLCTWKYTIRFSDFNPNNISETLKHVLCVENGKIVRYKG